TRMRILKQFVRVAPILLLAPILAGASLADAPKADAQFLARLSSAAKAGDVAAFKTATAPGVNADYAWVSKAPGMLTAARPWQVKPLDLTPIAGTSAGAFIAFTKYHPCESTGDHLYRLAATGDGPRLGAEIPE